MAIGKIPSARRHGAVFEERLMSSPAQKSLAEAQPLIAVRNVRASSRWYAELLGADTLPDHSHRDVYDRIWRSGRLLLQLHAWDVEEHPNLVNADAAPPDMASCCGFRSTISTRPSSEPAASRRRSSKNRTSTPRPTPGDLAPRHRRLCCGGRQSGRRKRLLNPAGSQGAVGRQSARQVMRCRTRSPLASQW